MERIEIKSQPTGPDAPVEVIPDIETATAESTSSEIRAEERPSWLPEKFNSPEDLAKAYGELEKQFTHKAQTAEAAKTDETKADAPKADDAVNQLVENAGLNMTDLSAEYEQSGQLTEESYEKLAKAGVNREYVDGYIRGQEALAVQYQSEVFDIAGGQQGYTEMIQWAARNLTTDEINAFNTSVNSGNLEQAKLSVQGMMSRFTASEGNEPRLVKGVATGDATAVFRSTAELVSAMKDPKYKNDPAYRQDVIEKLGRSSIF
ncbi:MAG: hypothetical protein AB7T49_20795 [Oligoflexales bacterium]